MIHFFRKAQLGKTIKMCEHWEHFFCGICIGQWGVGIIWRKKKLAKLSVDKLQMQSRDKKGSSK